MENLSSFLFLSGLAHKVYMADYFVFERRKIRLRRGELLELRGTWPSTEMKSLYYDPTAFEIRGQRRDQVETAEGDGGVGVPSVEVFVITPLRTGSSEIYYCYHVMPDGGKVHNAERYHVEVTD